LINPGQQSGVSALHFPFFLSFSSTSPKNSSVAAGYGGLAPVPGVCFQQVF